MLLGGLRLDELSVEVVEHQLGLEKAIIILDHELHPGRVFAAMLRILFEPGQVALHLLHSCIVMHRSQIGCRIEMQTLNQDLVHALAVILHKLGQIRDLTLRKRVYQS